jgi:hypothetical protein
LWEILKVVAGTTATTLIQSDRMKVANKKLKVVLEISIAKPYFASIATH